MGMDLSGSKGFLLLLSGPVEDTGDISRELLVILDEKKRSLFLFHCLSLETVCG